MSKTEEKYPQENYQKEYRKKHRNIWLSTSAHERLTELARKGYRTNKGQLELLIDKEYGELAEDES